MNGELVAGWQHRRQLRDMCVQRCWGQREFNLLEKGRRVTAVESLVVGEAGAEGRMWPSRWEQQSCRRGS